MVQFNNSWDILLKDEFQKPYYLNLRKFLVQEYKSQTIYPHMNDIFNALKYTDYKDVKVVILGQDPYHEENQANGLAFSVNKGVKIPPSLKNLYKELYNDLGIAIPNHGDLTSLTKQGVLLLNTVLTVRKGMAQSHHNYGWQKFTDEIIKVLNEENHPIVFILLGNDAKGKKCLITNPLHYIIEAIHPSPLSANRGFFGSKIYSKTNEFLIKNNLEPINFNTLNNEVYN